MAILPTKTPCPRLPSMAAAWSSRVKLSGGVVLAAKRTPSLSIGKGGRSHGRDVLLALSSRNCNNSTLACSFNGATRSSSFYVHVMDAGAASLADYPDDGIGITEFLGAKNFLITGGTGFLAKVLIEKILRTNPEVAKIYVLIRAKDTEGARKRLQNEVVDTDLFIRLKEIHGNGYHSFVERKLVPVVGDIRDPNIGIAADIANEIAKEVDIIVNSAANTTFNERYDVAIDTNTLGPFRIMSFAQRFQRLKLFLQVSTAYANGQRQGIVLEKPFLLGDTIAKELCKSADSSEQKNVVLDMEAEMKLAFNSIRHSEDSASFSQEMKDLGLQRAKLHGWQDTYSFTKAMGEMVINCMRGEIPVVTIRPSIIEGTLKDPFPGWIQGNRMLDPLIINYGKGRMTSLLGCPDSFADVVPADMVVNAMLASMAKHGEPARGAAAAGIHVYHVASSAVNPLVYRDLFQFLFQHFTRRPLVGGAAGQPIRVQQIRFCDGMAKYASEVEANAPLRAAAAERLSRRANDLRARGVQEMVRLGRMYEPYTFYGGRFDNTNMEALFSEMSEEERARFDFDFGSVDWMDYFTKVHIPGLRKHVMKGRGSV